jgi:hypothetical protein
MTSQIPTYNTENTEPDTEITEITGRPGEEFPCVRHPLGEFVLGDRIGFRSVLSVLLSYMLCFLVLSLCQCLFLVELL